MQISEEMAFGGASLSDIMTKITTPASKSSAIQQAEERLQILLPGI